MCEKTIFVNCFNFTIVSAMNRLYLFLTIVILCCACNRNNTAPSPTENTLYAIESFVGAKPDSALAILDTLPYQNLSEKEHAHYCLLIVKARHDMHLKDDALSDSLLQIASEAFIGGKDKYMEAQTYLYLGLTKMISVENDCKSSMDYMLKAVESIDKCKKVDERFKTFRNPKPSDEEVITETKCYIYQLLSSLCQTSGQLEEGLDYLRWIKDYHLSRHEENKMFRIYMRMGLLFLAQSEYDSCLYNYQKALAVAEQTQNLYDCAFGRDFLGHYYSVASDSISTDSTQRIELIDKGIKTVKEGLGFLQKVGEPSFSATKHIYYKQLSVLYFQKQVYDSCIYFSNLSQSPKDKLFNEDNKRLFRAYWKTGDLENAVHYADEYFRHNDGKEIQKKYDINKVKSDYEQQKAEAEMQFSKRLSMAISAIIILALAVVLLIILLIYRKYKTKAEWQQAVLSGKVKQANETIRNQEQAIRESKERETLLQEKIEHVDAEKQSYDRFLAEPVCIEILNSLQGKNIKSNSKTIDFKDIALRDEQMMQLMDAADRNLNHFPQKLKKQYPSLDATDIRYCCLYLLGLNEAQIAALVQRSYQSVWTRAKEMKTFFGSDGIGNALINLL